MGIDPNLDHMEAHLSLLYDWTHTDYPNALFEVRCIHPNGKVRDQRFTCMKDGYQEALRYAVEHNDQGYNIYVTINPLKPNTAHTATDEDVEIALYQCIDADGVDDPNSLLAECGQGFEPTFATITGTVPKPRCQIYWRQSEPVTDMMVWSSTQTGLAQQFGTDNTVKNPSRVLRLAGTVSSPPPHKQKRGYITEVTALDRTGNGEVCRETFTASFACVEPSKAAPEPVTYQPVRDEGTGKIPLCVIEAALAVIPPIMGGNQRNLWLDIAQACRDAHPDSWHPFDQWQRRSDRFAKSDSKVWETLKPPSAGSWKSLLAHAKRADPDWWKHHSGEVYDWGCQQAARPAALAQATNEETEALALSGITPPQPSQQGPILVAARKKFGLFTLSQLEVLPMPEWLFPDLLFRSQVGLVYSPPRQFKSFVCIDLMLRLAHGMEWQGRKLKPARVLYVAGEGFPMFYSRCLAWFKHHGILMDDENFVIVDRAVNLTDPAEVLEFIREIEKTYGKFDVTVYDTLSTCMAGQDECSSAVITAAIENAKLIGREVGCASLFVHHPGKDESRGSRGHSALLGNIDSEWHLERHNNEMGCKITITKQKDGPDGLVFHFRATVVPLGMLDELGRERSSLVLSPCDANELPDLTVATELADRVSIAAVMQFDDPISTAELAKRICKVLGCRQRAAADRINEAVPIEWTRVRRGNQVVELIRVLGGGNGKPNKIEMRRANPDGDAAEEE